MDVSRDAYDNQQQQVNELKSQLEVAKYKRQEARKEGDLRENAEYEIASAEVDRLSRDLEIADERLKSMVVTDTRNISGFVTIGNVVTLECMVGEIPKGLKNNDNKVRFTIVHKPQWASLDQIPDDSLLSKAILHHKVGDVVEYIDNMLEPRKFRITAIE